MSGGFVSYQFDPNQFFTQRDLNSFYANLTLQHRVNEWMDHQLSGGRQVQGGAVSAGAYELDSVRYEASIRVLKNLYFGPRLFYEHGNTVGGFPEVFDRWGIGLYVWRQITKQVSAAISYDFLHKTSSLPGQDYLQNRLVFNVRYGF
jgi:hypothetical protein